MARETTTRRTRRNEVETIKVTIAPLFGEVKTISVEKDATVEDALSAGGFSAGVEVRLNGGSTIESDTILEDGDELAIVSRGKVEGGM